MKRFKPMLKIAPYSPPGTILLPTPSASVFLIIATTEERRDIYRKDTSSFISVFVLAACNTLIHTHSHSQLLVLFSRPFTTTSPVWMCRVERHLTKTQGAMLISNLW